MDRQEIERIVRKEIESLTGQATSKVVGFPGAIAASADLSGKKSGCTCGGHGPCKGTCGGHGNCHGGGECSCGKHGKREYIVAANWKMNMTDKETKAFLSAMKGIEIAPHLKSVIFAPFVYLYNFRDMLRYEKIAYGAEDVAKEEKGAYTGEVSATMVADMGCSYALCGHSERRSYYGETPEIVALKAKAALGHQLIPMICIGETLEERKSNRYKEVLKVQLDAIAKELGAKIADTVIAYEPVWAIGTGVIPTDAEIADTHQYIHDLLASYPGVGENVPKILYGGSVNEKNVQTIAEINHVGGFLIGGASLKADKYSKIIELVS